MSGDEKQSTEQCTSNETVEILPMEPERRKRELNLVTMQTNIPKI